MRTLMLVSTLVLAGSATPAGAQAVEPRPPIAVVVVTLDDVRQGQVKHGRSLLQSLGDESFGLYRWVEPTVSASDFQSCEDDHAHYGLNYCARFYLHRGWAEGAPPTVVVAFTDWNDVSPRHRGGSEMRVLCYGRGAVASDTRAQDTWLWPDSARVRGIGDWQRDQKALADCIDAALAEEPGVPRPDPLPL